jgi:hypothetical protein
MPRKSMHRALLAGAASVSLAAGCASVPPAQLGQTAGTIAGAAIAPGIGAPIGALLGALAGMVVQRKVDQTTETRERRELGEQMAAVAAAGAPGQPVPQGEPVRVWVDETVKDGRLLPGHFEVRYVP